MSNIEKCFQKIFHSFYIHNSMLHQEAELCHKFLRGKNEEIFLWHETHTNDKKNYSDFFSEQYAERGRRNTCRHFFLWIILLIHHIDFPSFASIFPRNKFLLLCLFISSFFKKKNSHRYVDVQCFSFDFLSFQMTEGKNEFFIVKWKTGNTSAFLSSKWVTKSTILKFASRIIQHVLYK